MFGNFTQWLEQNPTALPLISTTAAMIAMIFGGLSALYQRSEYALKRRQARDEEKSRYLVGMSQLWSALQRRVTIPRKTDIKRIKKALLDDSLASSLIIIAGTSGQGKTMATVRALSRSAKHLSTKEHIEQVLRVDAARTQTAVETFRGEMDIQSPTAQEAYILQEISGLAGSVKQGADDNRLTSGNYLSAHKIVLWIEGVDNEEALERLIQLRRNGPLILHLTDTIFASELSENHSSHLVLFHNLSWKKLYRIFKTQSKGISLNSTEKRQFKETILTPFAASLAAHICNERKRINALPFWNPTEVLEKTSKKTGAKRHQGLNPWIDAILDLVSPDSYEILLFMAQYPDIDWPQSCLEKLFGIEDDPTAQSLFDRAEGLGLIEHNPVSDDSGFSQRYLNLAHGSLIKLLATRGDQSPLTNGRKLEPFWYWIRDTFKVICEKKSSLLKAPSSPLIRLNDRFVGELKDSERTSIVFDCSDDLQAFFQIQTNWGTNQMLTSVLKLHWDHLSKNKDLPVASGFATALIEAWTQIGQWDYAEEWKDILCSWLSEMDAESDKSSTDLQYQTLKLWVTLCSRQGLWERSISAQNTLLAYVEHAFGTLSSEAEAIRQRCDNWSTKANYNKQESWPLFWTLAQARHWKALALEPLIGLSHQDTQRRQTAVLNDADLFELNGEILPILRDVHDILDGQNPSGDSASLHTLRLELSIVYENTGQYAEAYAFFKSWFNREHPRPDALAFTDLQKDWQRLQSLSIAALAWEDIFTTIHAYWKAAHYSGVSPSEDDLIRISRAAHDILVAPVSMNHWYEAILCLEWILAHSIAHYPLHPGSGRMKMLFCTSEVHRFRQNYTQALEFALQVYQVQKEILPQHNRDRLVSEGTLASIYRHKGDLDKALEFALQVCQVQKEILPQHNRDRLVSEGTLASIYKDKGDLDKALEFALQVYQVQKEILPQHNRDRLISEGTLASIYLNKGDLDKALEFALQVCQVQKEILPEHNRDRLVSEGELANIYLYQGDLDKALEFAIQDYQVQKEMLPNDNRDRLISEFRLARISLKSGVFDPYYNILIEQPPNLEDPDKIYNQAYLAAYSFLKEDAESMNRAIESVLQISEQSTLHGYDRERNLLIIAEIYLRQQDYPKALALLERVWTAYNQGHLKEFVYWKKIAKHRLQSCLLSMQLELHPMFPSPEEQPLEDPIHGEWPV